VGEGEAPLFSNAPILTGSFCTKSDRNINV
jgi:hypothetical protein